MVIRSCCKLQISSNSVNTNFNYTFHFTRNQYSTKYFSFIMQHSNCQDLYGNSISFTHHWTVNWYCLTVFKNILKRHIRTSLKVLAIRCYQAFKEPGKFWKTYWFDILSLQQLSYSLEHWECYTTMYSNISRPSIYHSIAYSSFCHSYLGW